MVPRRIAMTPNNSDRPAPMNTILSQILLALGISASKTEIAARTPKNIRLTPYAPSEPSKIMSATKQIIEVCFLNSDLRNLSAITLASVSHAIDDASVTRSHLVLTLNRPSPNAVAHTVQRIFSDHRYFFSVSVVR